MSNPSVISVIRASNAFIYLPLYLAEDAKLFEQVQRPYAPTAPLKYNFRRSRRSEIEGDVNALKEMHELSQRGDLAFAVCDPLHLFDTGIDPSEFRVIGALIKSPPFWVVNGEEANTIDDLKIKRLVAYSSVLKTGQFLGRYIQAKKSSIILEDIISEVGGELDCLIEHKAMGDYSYGAVSVDILGLAKAVHKPSGHSQHCKPIFYLGNEFRNFVTTGFVTTASTCQRHPEAIGFFTEAVARAIDSMFVQSTVAERCRLMSANRDFFKGQLSLNNETGAAEPLDTREAAWVAAEIARHEIYRKDLRISREDWIEAAKADRRIANGFENIAALYDVVVHSDAKVPETDADRKKPTEGPESKARGVTEAPSELGAEEQSDTAKNSGGKLHLTLRSLSWLLAGIFVSAVMPSLPVLFRYWPCAAAPSLWMCATGASMIDLAVRTGSVLALAACFWILMNSVISSNQLRLSGIVRSRNLRVVAGCLTVAAAIFFGWLAGDVKGLFVNVAASAFVAGVILLWRR